MHAEVGYVGRPVVRSYIPKRVSWAAIFAGTFVAMAVWVLLLLLGMAVAAATINPATEPRPAEGVAIGLGIWWLVVSIASLFIGGWVAARLAPTPSRTEASLHGAVVWGLTMVLLLYVVSTSAASIAGGALGTLQTALSSRQTSISFQDGNPQVGWGGQDQGSRQQEPRMTRDERERAIDDLMRRSGMSYGEAQSTIDRWERERMDQQRQATGQQGNRLMATPEVSERELRQAGQATADTLAATAAWSFFAMLLGLAAALAGGATGRTRTYERDMED